MASDVCEANLCNGGRCPQPGASCGDGWECVHHSGGVFAPEYDWCQMICSGAEPRCPEYYSCNDDRHCDYGGAAITYSPAEPVANEPVTFTAHFFYNKTRSRADWLFDMNGLAQQAQGETATVMFTSRGEVTAGFVAEYADEAGPQQAMVKVTIH